VMTALITPFTDGIVDYDALATLADWHIQFGISALVPCGTTGEAPTVAWDERLKIIGTCVKTSHGRVPAIAGTGTNSTELTFAHTSAAQSCGADAALVVTPL
jgi:4-hydroxy-tetrahydrodipicolinate synthase